MEDLLNSLVRTLESSSGRSTGMMIAAIGLMVWWGVRSVRKGIQKVKGEVAVVEAEKAVEIERPRKRLPLRAFHR